MPQQQSSGYGSAPAKDDKHPCLTIEVLTRDDAHVAAILHKRNFPDDLFTPVFAISRMSGWAAHVLEQYGDNRLIRPRAEYTGAYDRHYTPIDER